MYAKDTVNGQIIGAVIGAWIVVALSMKFGTPVWKTMDKFCLGGAALGIALWLLFDSPTVGIVTSSTVVFIGSFPTFAGAWNQPEEEDRTAWTLYWVSCVAALIAVPAWTLADAAQPITFFAIESVMMYLLWLRPRRTDIRTQQEA